jgi:signal peptidase II
MSRVIAGTTVGRWATFFGIAAIVVILDQVSKAWVVANFPLDEPVEVIGDLLRIWYIHNAGALFGLFQQQAFLFGVISLVVIGVIVWLHAKMSGTGGWLATVGMGLLLGGAVGNMIDRFRFGYVVDFVDIGIGGWRFFTFNIADACIDIGIVILVVLAFVPAIGHRFGGSRGTAANASAVGVPSAAASPAAAGTGDGPGDGAGR